MQPTLAIISLTSVHLNTALGHEHLHTPLHYNLPSHWLHQATSFSLSHHNLLSQGVVDRMSRLKKMCITTTYPRIAITEGTSLELHPHGLRVKTSREKFPRLHGVRLTTAYLRIALITSLSSRSAVARAEIYHRVGFAILCWDLPSHCACSMRFRTAFITDTFSRFASLLLTFALTSQNHLFTAPHYNLFPHGVVDSMSRLKKMRLTTSNPRMAFAESNSLKLPPHGLCVKNFT